MDRFEYMTLFRDETGQWYESTTGEETTPVDFRRYLELLNYYGEQGWELAKIIIGDDDREVSLLKRKKARQASRKPSG